MKLKYAIISIAMMLWTLSSFAQGGLDVKHLSASHTMVRVLSSDRYVLLPVQEDAREATVQVLVNTVSCQSSRVRLAVDRTDYYVPLDLGSWSGKDIVIDIVRAAERGSGRSISADSCWKGISTSNAFESPNKDYYRPKMHFTPAYGWMNDPNGLVYKDGEYHLFFQHNPYGSMWGNMTWGHAVTRDFIHWDQLPNAIMADALGAVFSGSAIVDKENVAGFGRGAIVAMYTSSGSSQTQSLAYSLDGGRTFTKYSGNPVIVADIPDFRDPKMFFDEKSGKWKVILASGQEVRFYASSNLKDWTYESSFGLSYGNHGGVWECPDMVRFGDKDVLIVNINPGGPFGGSATQYFVGKYDGHDFLCDDAPSTEKWMDYGKDHYATVTWSNVPDGRHLAIAWMSNWEYGNVVPTQQYRSANSIARELSLKPRDGSYIMCSSPVKEMLSLRGTPSSKTFKKGSVAVPSGCSEIVLSFPSSSSKSVFTLSNSKGEKVTLTYDPSGRCFAMDRSESGVTSFSDKFPCVTTAPTLPGGKVQIRIFIDTCSMEIFGDDFAMTNLVFPTQPYDTLEVQGASRTSVTVYPLNI
ncbi:MAG: DUF4980 domain-containing protein [Bacteroidales bacterium]|nr:DUF4980 domain-containing protein [Bacteroidales bacterium]